MIENSSHNSQKEFHWMYGIFLIIILLVAAYFRLTGSDWGQLNIQHPDENFMTSVTLAIRPLSRLEDYFSTSSSTLNPANVGFPAYVYGTLPLFLVRYLAEIFHKLNAVTLFGRQLSAIADLGTIVLLYFIVKRFYHERVALLATAFSALVVTQIQQSHFYTTDNFYNFFMFLTLFVAAVIATGKWKEPDNHHRGNLNGALFYPSLWHSFLELLHNPLTYLTIAFGISLGMAVASKLNAAAIAIVLPIALIIRYFKSKQRTPLQEGQERSNIISSSQLSGKVNWSQIEEFIGKALIFLVMGAIVSILVFRVFQPYAFIGPGFFGLKINPQWLEKIREQLHQASPDADLPWSLQWARRNHLYSFQNLTVWGLGLPLGLLAWAGFIWMGVRIFKGEWKKHLLLWSWTGIYFIWQSLQYNPNMRYQLPVYPLLAMMAAWVPFRLAKICRTKYSKFNWRTVLAALIGLVVLTTIALYAYGFSRIYVRPETRIAASNWIYQNVPGPINLLIQTGDATMHQQPLPYAPGAILQAENPYTMIFVAQYEGHLTSILLGHVADLSTSGQQTLRVQLSPVTDPQEVLTSAFRTADFAATTDSRGDPLSLVLDHPLSLQRGTSYSLQIQVTGGTFTLVGSAIANETDYDYPLPFRTEAYDPFGGIYLGGLNLQVYWDDNADKLARFESVLDQADYIFIPTNHQYGQITRLPERYPLTTEYYRQLIGCPSDKDIIWCYRQAEPGMFQGNLGFELVATFESYPTIGPLTLNDQTAEESFTFYDHPKVLIFRKSTNFQLAHVKSILGQVDLSHVIHLTPRQADNYKSLMLPSDQSAVQQAGGTWASLFDRDALYNQFPVLGLVIWYLVILALGLFVYPLLRAALPGLPDHGYPLARIAGLLLWAWLVWMAGSLGLSYSKPIIGCALGLVVLIGIWQGWRQRNELSHEIRTRWKYFLMVEAFFLLFFLINLGIRLGNPDLWHDPDGGERPMDFAYFNAVLKSTTFPPYDPWFSGGYINYYYYGYVLVGTPVKLLGIVPSIAYNLILPTLFACLGIGAFSLGWNLLVKEDSLRNITWRNLIKQNAFMGGLAASAALILLGNLGTIRLLYRGFICMAAPAAQLGTFSIHDCIIAPGVPPIDKSGIFLHLWWTIKGFFLSLGGVGLPLSNREWMMTPSRALPGISGDPITEFPLFTFLWSDLHAHMIAFSITIMAISWALSVLLAKGYWKNRLDLFLGFLLGGLVIGALRPTNTWDFYTYLVLGCVILAYVVLRYSSGMLTDHSLPIWINRLFLTLLAVFSLVSLSLLLYLPFSHWFAQGYSSLEFWNGSRSNVSSYLVHWGIFLFFIVSWLLWETRQWLAETPASALKKIRPYRDIIIAMIVVVVLILVAQQAWVMSSSQNVPFKGLTILWLALPLAIWAAVLIFRPAISDGKRLVLFMVGTSLLLTMVVEIVVLRGDVGRMNTVFKFYLEAWIMLGISSAAAFGWLLLEFRKWLPTWRHLWMSVAILMVASGAYYFVSASAAKIRDRMNPSAPHGLDSMSYLAYFPPYYYFGATMDLSEDYRAFLWMQSNVQGSPVIVEAAAAGIQYAWFSRYSVYTGLPDVVGWQWHEQQQRVLFSNDVINRGKEVDQFYETTDIVVARNFLHNYNVRFIIVGQLEHAKYDPGAPGGPVLQESQNGLVKFDQYNGEYWMEVYRDGNTVIYEVPIGY